MVLFRYPAKGWVYFLVLLLASFVLNAITKHTLDSEKLIFDSLAEQLTANQLEQIIEFKEKNQWIGYILLPVFILVKTSLIASILDLGCFIFNKKVRYENLFNIVVKAEFIFLLVAVFKTAWFYFIQRNFTLEGLQYFYPLSAINLVGYEGLEPWWIYPLQVLNLFELVYWFILAYLIGKEIGDTVSTKGLQIVASSYGVGLVIWVASVMFFTLNMS